MRISKYFKYNSDVQEIILKAGFTVPVKIFGMLFGIVLSITIAKHLGAAGLGIINIANGLLSILLTISIFGFSTAMLRETSVLYERNKFRDIASVLSSVKLFGIISSGILGLSLIIFSNYLSINIYQHPKLDIILKIYSIILVFQLLTRFNCAAIKGTRNIWQSIFFSELFHKLVATILIYIIIFTNKTIDIIIVVVCFAIAHIVTFIVSQIYWGKKFNYKNGGQNKLKNLSKIAIPLFFSNASNLNYAILVLILGYFVTKTDIGVFSIAMQIGIIINLSLNVILPSASPKFAALYYTSETKELQITVTKLSRILLISSIIQILIIIIFGSKILAIWGTEFAEGYLVLVILSIGQFFKVSFGCSGSLLKMAGQEKLFARISIYSAILNMILLILLIPIFGLLGAAVTNMSIQILESTSKSIFCYYKLNLIVLPFIKKWKSISAS